jgi:hypothetical protein
MDRRLSRVGAALALAIAALPLVGCGRDTAVERRPKAAAPSEPTYRDFGNFQLHYNAIRSTEIAPEIASRYGIRRSPQRVLINVALLRERPDGTTIPVDAEVTVGARTLTGQVRRVSMRRVVEEPSIYFLGEAEISGNEIVVFDIDARPLEGGVAYEAQFKREFFAD